MPSMINNPLCLNKLFWSKVSDIQINLELELSIFYGVGKLPIYYSSSDISFTSSFNVFKKTDAYKELRRQYRLLMQDLRRWCDIHKVLYMIEESDVEFEGFEYLERKIERVLDASTYHEFQPVFLNEAKIQLEVLWCLLQRTDIHLELKQNTLFNLQQSFNVCPDGFLSHLLDAKNDLIASQHSFSLVYQVKRNLVRQIAAETLREHDLFEPELEVHRINYLQNSISDFTGLDRVIDESATRALFENPIQFHQVLISRLDVKSIVDNVIAQYSFLYSKLVQTIKQHCFESSTSLLIENPNRLVIQRYIDEWNQQHHHFCPLTTHHFIDVNDAGTQMIFSPSLINELVPMMVKSFRRLYFSENAVSCITLRMFLKEGFEPSFIYNPEVGITLFYDMGYTWFEYQGQVIGDADKTLPFDLNRVVASTPAERSYLVNLYVNAGKIPSHIVDAEVAKMLLFLDFDDAFKMCISHGRITVDYLFSTVGQHSFASGYTLFECLIMKSKVDIIKQWLEWNASNPESHDVFSRSTPNGSLFLTMLNCSQFDLITYCIKQKLLRPLHIPVPLENDSASVVNSDGIESDVAKYLFYRKQYQLLELMIDEKLLQSHHFRDDNVIYGLLGERQPELVRKLILNRMVSISHIRYKDGMVMFMASRDRLFPVQRIIYHSTVLLSLVEKGYRDIIEIILENYSNSLERTDFTDQLNFGYSSTGYAVTSSVLDVLIKKRETKIIALIYSNRLVDFNDVKNTLTQEQMFQAIFLRLKLQCTENNLQNLAQALRRATVMQAIDEVRYLLDKVPEIINMQDNNPQKRKTALHLAVELMSNRDTASSAKTKYSEIALLLCERGAEIEIPDANGNTARDIFPPVGDKVCGMSPKG